MFVSYKHENIEPERWMHIQRTACFRFCRLENFSSCNIGTPSTVKWVLSEIKYVHVG